VDSREDDTALWKVTLIFFPSETHAAGTRTVECSAEKLGRICVENQGIRRPCRKPSRVICLSQKNDQGQLPHLNISAEAREVKI
jgi:hypothetical protein